MLSLVSGTMVKAPITGPHPNIAGSMRTPGTTMTDEYEFVEAEIPKTKKKTRKAKREKASEATPRIDKVGPIKVETEEKTLFGKPFTFYRARCPRCPHKTEGSLNENGARETLRSHIENWHRKVRR